MFQIRFFHKKIYFLIRKSQTMNKEANKKPNNEQRRTNIKSSSKHGRMQPVPENAKYKSDEKIETLEPI